MKRFYLLALAATLAFGCKKDDGDPRPNLNIEKTEYAFDAVENRTATVAFTAAATGRFRSCTTMNPPPTG